MLKISTLFLMVLAYTGSYSQEANTAAGGEASGAGGSSSYSIGQIVYTTDTGSNGSVAKGVQQPYEISAVIGIEVVNINLSMSVYPNPSTDQLTLKIEDINFSSMKYLLFDLQGKLLETDKISAGTTSIDVAGLPASTYFLKVLDNQKEIKTFKIIKN